MPRSITTCTAVRHLWVSFFISSQEAKKEQFCVSKEQKIPKGYAIHFNDGKHTYSKNEDWKPGTYYVTKGYSILRTNFETKEAALKWVQELAKGRNKNGKIRFVPPQLAHVKRTGPDYRNGVEITGQHYLDTFGFRGGEFGNWMNQNDRQISLNMGFEALKDLASALKISDKDIAYQGTLAIAFGARGSGNAAAHYEPLRTVINLTKMHGAGSLAHEWWHGLDDYLGTKMGAKGMLSEQPRLYAPFQKLIDTMKYKPETPEQAAKRTEAQTERTRKNAAGWLDSSVLASLKRYGNEEQMETYAVLREAFLSGEPGSVEQISAFKKNVTGRVIPKSERERLEIFERMLSGMQAQEAPQIGRTETDFYRNSVRMGKECEKDGGYWDSNVEMTARAFACYIKDKLPYTSDYLAGHADCALTLVSGKDGEMEVLKAFPVGEERRAINAVFDEIIQDLKREQLLTHLDMLGDERTALFLIMSDTDGTFAFLISLIYSILFNRLCERADDVYGGRLPIHVRCLIDEAANIGQIPNLERLMATIRSREISACLVLQAQSQLKALYKDNMDTIIGNCDASLFLGGKEETTLKSWNSLLGKETIDLYNTSVTKGNQESHGQNFQKLGKDLMSVDELAVMDGGKCLLQIRGVRPFLSRKYDITKHPNYKLLSDFNEKNAFNIEKFLSTRMPMRPGERYRNYEVTAEDLASQTL